jgi:ribonuclease BN (tRNA processing enzyme)
MRLTTIGTGAVAPAAARVCPGHLVEAGDVTLLLDCGNGVVHRMAALGAPWTRITHLALTHFHTDHIGDVPLLMMAWRYGTLPPRSAPVDILGPPGTADLLSRLADAFGGWMRAPGYPVHVHELPPGDGVALGAGARLACRQVPHTPESVAYSVEAGGRRVVYTGDTAFDAELGRWAEGCDVLLAECSLPRALAVPGHLTPEECGALAALARPGLLALTHFYPPVERVDIRGLVAGAFDGAVALAADGWSIEIEDG